MIIGVTGIFGSGKTIVARTIAKKLRCPVVNADEIAHRVFEKNKPKIKRVFGTTDRREIAKIVFDSRRKLNALQKIIHPAVLMEMKRRAKKGVKKEGSAVLDVPLLVESGSHRFVDIVVVVSCRERQRLRRLIKKGFSAGEIRQRTRSQLPLKRKIKHADYVIDNSGSLKKTEKQVEKMLKRLSKGKKSG